MIKKILMIVVAAIVSFGSTFAIVWFTRSKQPDVAAADVSQANTASLAPTAQQNTIHENRLANTKSMTEKRLKTLIGHVRNKVSDYKNREKQLDAYQKRLAVTKHTLTEEVTRLTSLQEELSQAILNLKNQQQQLDKRILEIKKDETARFQQLAGVYDKMDEKAAAKILVNMISNSQIDDAAKILYYMSDRKSAKLLAEISNKEATLARVLCTRLKNIKEENN